MPKLDKETNENVLKHMKELSENLAIIQSQMIELKKYAAGNNVTSQIESIGWMINQIIAAKKFIEYTDEGLNQFVSLKLDKAGGFHHRWIKWNLSALQNNETINFEGKHDSLIRRFCRNVTKLLQCFGAPEDQNLLAERFGRNLFFPNKRTEEDQKSIAALLKIISEANKKVETAFEGLRAINKVVNPFEPESNYMPGSQG